MGVLLPLFPLPNVVLMPGLVVPLYVFEPRYRELLAQVRASGEPFGIIRITRGAAEGNEPFLDRVTRWGTYAHLREVMEHEDGSASILIQGGERFEVQSFDTSRSFLQANVNDLPLAPSDEEVAAALSRTLLAGVEAARPADAQQIHASAPSDPLVLASYAAVLLPITADQREQALMAASLVERLELLLGWVPGDSRTLN